MLIAALTTKFLVVLLVAWIVPWPTVDRVERFLAAWIMVHAGFISVASVLSVFSVLDGTGVGVCFAILIVSLLVRVAVVGSKDTRVHKRTGYPRIGEEASARRHDAGGKGLSRIPLLRADMLWYLPILSLTLLLAARATIFQDFTLDAQTYGLVRQAFWLNTRSILEFAQTPQVNVFSNEWNGELVGLFYVLVDGGLQGPLMAGAEMLALTYLAALWIARQITESVSWQHATAALAASVPACLGLATTVKGDLLAVAGLMMAVGWLLNAWRTRQGFPAAMCFTSLALAVGSKIAVVFPAIFIAVPALLLARPHLRTRPSIVFALICNVLLLRFWLNLMQYGNAVQRVESEQASPELANLLGNIRLVWGSLFDFTFHPAGEPIYATHLTGGFGITGFITAVALVYAIATRRPVLALVALLLIGTAVTGLVVPAYPWNFRYFLPGVLASATILIAILPIMRRLYAALAIALVVGANTWYLAWAGELNGNGPLSRALAELPSIQDPIRKTFLAENTIRPIDIRGVLDLDRKEPLRIVVYQDINVGILPLQGGRAQHVLRLSASKADFIDAVARQRPNLAVFASPREQDGVVQSLVAAGYSMVDVAPGYLVGLDETQSDSPKPAAR